MVSDEGGWVSKVSELFSAGGRFVPRVRKMFFDGSHWHEIAPTGICGGGGWVPAGREMVSGGGSRRMRAVVGRQGRGELHSPQHVPTRDGGA